jgi:hypothetical protein
MIGNFCGRCRLGNENMEGRNEVKIKRGKIKVKSGVDWVFFFFPESTRKGQVISREEY